MRPSKPAQTTERVAVIIPMLNESGHVDHLVDDLAAQDFEGPLEVFVADGGSTDGSREQLVDAAGRARLALTLLENPGRRAAPGLNVCIRAAQGRADLLVRLDCHTRYPADYVRRCVEAADATGAWNVGGVFDAVGDTPTERAVACAHDSPFGGHNWTRNMARSDRVEVDTNYLGAFRPEAFERIGLFDESLGVTEVEDLNLRLRRAGGRIVLDPSIRSYYTPRGTFRKVFVQYYRYGVWKVPVMVKHRNVVSGRSLVPILFVLGTAGLALAAIWIPAARWALAAELGIYAVLVLVSATAAVRKRGESWSLLPRVAAVFPTFHVAHGLGQIHGWLRIALRRR